MSTPTRQMESKNGGKVRKYLHYKVAKSKNKPKSGNIFSVPNVDSGIRKAGGESQWGVGWQPCRKKCWKPAEKRRINIYEMFSQILQIKSNCWQKWRDLWFGRREEELWKLRLWQRIGGGESPHLFTFFCSTCGNPGGRQCNFLPYLCPSINSRKVVRKVLGNSRKVAHKGAQPARWPEGGN